MNGLKILYLEKSEFDVEIVKYIFKRENIEINLKQVTNRKDYIRQLNDFKPDIILANFLQPSFECIEALQTVRETDPDIPFIFLSGIMGEENAIEVIKSGATDYVLKHRLSRLVPAIRRALLEAREKAKRIEAEKLKQKYDFIVNASRSMFTLIDRQYIYEAVNDAFCRAHKLVRIEIIGKSPAQIWGKQVFEKYIKKNLEQCFLDDVVRYQAWFKVPKFGLRCFEVTFYPYKEYGQDVTHTVVDTMDITDETRLQNYLQRAQRMETIGTLAGGIAHDFNNILATIIGYTDIAMQDLPREHTSFRDLEQILKASNRAKDLVNKILTFSRQMESKTESVSLSSYIQDTVRMLEGSIPEKIKIRTSLDPVCPPVMADPSHLHQIIMNICTNAFYAMRKKGGYLHITLKSLNVDDKFLSKYPNLRKGKYVRMDFRDTGIGIKQDLLERIFEPFFTTKPVGEGTGLGLSVVHGLVKNMNGEILVESKPGKGSTFSVLLPAGKTHMSKK
jgi:two-component system cell cycle sensor histidine kinase/response regulator CckA